MMNIGDLHPISASPCRVYKNRLSRLRERGGFSAKAVVLRLNSALLRDAVDIMLKEVNNEIVQITQCLFNCVNGLK